MAQNDIYRVTANFSGPNGNLRNWVWHYIQFAAGDPSKADIIDAIVTLLLAVWTILKEWIDTDTVGTTVELAKWDATLKQFDTIEVADISTYVGEATNSSMAGNVAPYITFFTGKARSRGKKFLFDVDRSAVTDSAVQAGLLTDMAGASVVWNNPVNADGVQFRAINFNSVAETYTFWQTDQSGVGIFAGSQYRRLPGRGA